MIWGFLFSWVSFYFLFFILVTIHSFINVISGVYLMFIFSSAGAIAGGVIGGIVALAVICTIVICVCVKVCKTQNHGQVLVYPQQPAVYTSSTTQQGYSQPPAPVYPYPPPTYSSGQQVFSYSGQDVHQKKLSATNLIST